MPMIHLSTNKQHEAYRVFTSLLLLFIFILFISKPAYGGQIGIFIDNPDKDSAYPGDEVHIPGEIDNTGTKTEVYLEVDNSSTTWPATVAPTHFILSDGENANFTITVYVPLNITPGHYNVTYTINITEISYVGDVPVNSQKGTSGSKFSIQIMPREDNSSTPSPGPSTQRPLPTIWIPICLAIIALFITPLVLKTTKKPKREH